MPHRLRLAALTAIAAWALPALGSAAEPGGREVPLATLSWFAAAAGVALVAVAVLRARRDRFQAALAASLGTFLLLLPVLMSGVQHRPAAVEAAQPPAPPTLATTQPLQIGPPSPGSVPLPGLLTSADPTATPLIPPAATALAEDALPAYGPQVTASSALAVSQSSGAGPQPTVLPPFALGLPEPVLRLPAEPMLGSQLALYPQMPLGGVLASSRYPLSTFPVRLGSASYLDMRRFLAEGILPPTGIVRVEEFLNYFPYAYPAAKPGSGLRVVTALYPAPWNERAEILHLALVAEPPPEPRPPMVLVVLADISGSMAAQNRLPMLKQGLGDFLGALGPQDRLSLMTYAGEARRDLPPTLAEKADSIRAAIDGLRSGGTERAPDRLRRAFAMAEKAMQDSPNVRVLLATDGDINLGQGSDAELTAFIRSQRNQGIGFSVLNLASGTPHNAAMERLARAGDGTVYAVDTLPELKQALMAERNAASGPRIGGLQVQVRFNPERVSYYRLIGYETRSMEAESAGDAEGSMLDAGDQVTALYEIRQAEGAASRPQNLAPTVVGEPAYFTAPNALALVTVSGTRQQDGMKIETEELVTSADLQEEMSALPADYRFAAAVAGFAQLLRAEPAVAGVQIDRLRRLAAPALASDPDGRRAEFVALLERAKRARPLGTPLSDLRP